MLHDRHSPPELGLESGRLTMRDANLSAGLPVAITPQTDAVVAAGYRDGRRCTPAVAPIDLDESAGGRAGDGQRFTLVRRLLEKGNVPVDAGPGRGEQLPSTGEPDSRGRCHAGCDCWYCEGVAPVSGKQPGSGAEQERCTTDDEPAPGRAQGSPNTRTCGWIEDEGVKRTDPLTHWKPPNLGLQAHSDTAAQPVLPD